MRVLIVGAGLTGCVLARLMEDLNNEVNIIEKKDHLGGLCYTTISPNGVYYEPYGAHAFHTNDSQIKKFVMRFSDFNNYKHEKGIIIQDKLLHFPLSKDSILEMEKSTQILKELEQRPYVPDFTNFETYAISTFGPTLYKLFMYNYSTKMWGLEPRYLTTEYIKNRIELRENKTHIFNDNFQGLPVHGYTQFFQNMIKDIPLTLRESEYNESSYDLILLSSRIDELFQYKYGALEYRSLEFYYEQNGEWENNRYGSINLPDHDQFIRKVNFKVMHQQETDQSWIQYQTPISSNGKNLPLYPIYTRKNIELFRLYLKDACKSDKIIPVGRLGLYKYLEMGQAMSLAMKMIPLIQNWKDLHPNERFSEITNLLYN